MRGWTHLERQKGGIGLRGPGETQLETDRRLIGKRIRQLHARLEHVDARRTMNRQNRVRAEVPTVDPLEVLCGACAAAGVRPRWLLLGLLAGAILFAMGSRTPLFPLLFHAVPGFDHFRVPARAMIFASLFAVLLAITLAQLKLMRAR